MDFNVIIEEFQRVALLMVRNYTPLCLNMMYILATIDLTLSLLFDSNDLDGLGIFILYMKKTLLYGFFLYVITNYESVVLRQILGGFIQLGNVGVGKGTATYLVTSPGRILGTVMVLLSPFLIGGTLGIMVLDKLGIESIPVGVFILVIGIILFATLTCLEIAITFIKFYLVAGFAIVLLPFGVFSKTKDIGMKGLHAIFAQGVEIMVLVTVVNLCDLFIDRFLGVDNINFSTPIGFINTFVIILVLFGLITKVPGVVGTLISGSVSSLGLADTGTKGSMHIMGQGVKTLQDAGKNIYSAYTAATN